MVDSVRVKTRKIIVVADDDTIVKLREAEMLDVFRAKQLCLNRCRYVDTTVAQRQRDGTGCVFVKMKPNRHSGPGRLSWREVLEDSLS